MQFNEFRQHLTPVNVTILEWLARVFGMTTSHGSASLAIYSAV